MYIFYFYQTNKYSQASLISFSFEKIIQLDLQVEGKMLCAISVAKFKQVPSSKKRFSSFTGLKPKESITSSTESKISIESITQKRKSRMLQFNTWEEALGTYFKTFILPGELGRGWEKDLKLYSPSMSCLF
jgi:hypothetical protein